MRTKDDPTETWPTDEEQDEEEQETLEETWRRYADELATICEQSAQTNELLNLYMSFAMHEGPPARPLSRSKGRTDTKYVAVKSVNTR